MTCEPLAGHRSAAVHPGPVRALHWINAAAIIVMIGSGLTIQNADPILPFVVPEHWRIGADLIGALRWHFAVMWVLAINGAIYLALGLWSGRFARKLWPISPRGVLRDVWAALTCRLGHKDLSVYNQVQRLLYGGVILIGGVALLSGLALWKPVQLAPLLLLLGDFDTARIVHFACMALIAGFTLIHVVMALLVPRSIRLMVLGGAQ